MTMNKYAELDVLRKELLLMGSMVEEAVHSAASALVDRRADLVDQVIAGDKAIDAKETVIEEECQRLLALTAPVAGHLRIVITAIRVANELERMGDHAKSIAYAAQNLSGETALPVYDELRTMSTKTISMVAASLDCLVNQDIDKARQVHASDDEVDELYHHIMAQVSHLMQEQEASITCGLESIRAARNLERVADLATNIAKDVIYLVEGQLVRHRHEREGSGI